MSRVCWWFGVFMILLVEYWKVLLLMVWVYCWMDCCVVSRLLWYWCGCFCLIGLVYLLLGVIWCREIVWRCWMNRMVG